jgi:hypothetical protein
MHSYLLYLTMAVAAMLGGRLPGFIEWLRSPFSQQYEAVHR